MCMCVYECVFVYECMHVCVYACVCVRACVCVIVCGKENNVSELAWFTCVKYHKVY